MEMKRVVVVGCGSIGRRHARALARRGDVALELCEPQPDNLQLSLSEVGPVPTHTAFDAMLQTKPEMVIIATPHALHAPQTGAALDAGAHVLCEKPMADTVANAQTMLAAAQRSGRVLSIGFTNHFHPAMQRIKALIQSGELGTLLHVHWHIGTYLTLLSSVSRHQATLDGSIMMDYAHQPDLLYWWLGERPTRVYAAGRQAGALPLQSNPNVLLVTLEYASPLLATIHLNYVQHPQRAGCEITGDQGWLLFDMGNGQLRRGKQADASEVTETIAVERDALFRDEHQAFFNAVAGRRAPESAGHEAIVSQQIIEAVLASWRRQEPVSLA